MVTHFILCLSKVHLYENSQAYYRQWLEKWLHKHSKTSLLTNPCP